MKQTSKFIVALDGNNDSSDKIHPEILRFKEKRVIKSPLQKQSVQLLKQQPDPVISFLIRIFQVTKTTIITFIFLKSVAGEVISRTF